MEISQSQFSEDNDQSSDSKEKECKNSNSHEVDDLEEIKDVWVTPLKGELPPKQRRRISETCSERGDKADLLFSNLTKTCSQHKEGNTKHNKSIINQSQTDYQLIQKLGGRKESLLLESKLSCLNREVLTHLVLEILAEFPEAKSMVEKKYADTLNFFSF